MSTAESDKQNVSGASGPAHALLYNNNPRTISWERLELDRLKKLNLGPERYSRHFQRFSADDKMSASFDSALLAVSGQTTTHFLLASKEELKKNNSIAPFSTVEKPTCGCFFSRSTDNKKKKFGIPPTNLVKWRSFVQ